MSTWHQDKAGPVAAPTKWVIETNPPNEMRTRMTFPSKEAAEQCLSEWKAAGRGAYSYVIGPPRDYEEERAALAKVSK